MKLTFLNSKLHRATVTKTLLEYEGSLSIDASLMDRARITAYEQVEVYNLNNGARFTTYAISAAAGSGEICVNGAAARLASPGDEVIIVTYVQLEPDEVASHRPTIVLVDANNQPKS